MFDIHFFKNCREIKEKILNRKISLDTSEIYKVFESFRSRHPFVFNIETTNACNMQCIMCTRPKLMTRPVRHMDMGLFKKIIAQITPYEDSELKDFWKFTADKYSIRPQDRNENTFYFYTMSECLCLHGYGEPVLDPYITERIRLCSERNIPTYFSCVPANIDVEKAVEMIKAGLGVIKFSMDALDDDTQKKIRGEKNDFSNSFKKILDLIEIKSENPSLETQIVVTMIALSSSEEAAKMHRDFMKLWNGKPVYAYIKSQDNRWFYEGDHNLECKSHYASQYCEFPWTSMGIAVDGSVVPCTEDFDNEIVLGDANTQPLKEIWNSSTYDNFRKLHITGDFAKNHNKCVSRCDQNLICDRVKEKKNA